MDTPPLGPGTPQPPPDPYAQQAHPYQQHDPHQQHDPYQRHDPYGQPPAYQQPSAYPYGVPPQYPGGPAAPYGGPPPLNGTSVAALVFGILCLVPAVGLVLGVVALGQIRRRGERGRGFAVTGIALSTLGLLMIALSLTAGLDGFRDGYREGTDDRSGDSSAFTVRTGECFDTPGGSLEGTAYDVTKVPCAGKHNAEVFGAFKVPDGGYPGEDDLADTADDRCFRLVRDYAMDTWALPETVDVYYFTPTQQSWEIGDREVTCLFGSSDKGGTLTDSLRADATTLDDDQVAYLKADNVLNDALDTAPTARYVDDDLTGHQQWATRVADALARQTAMLRAHTFPSASRGRIDAAVRDLDTARGEWTRAAESSDASTFYGHYDKAYALLEGAAVKAARKTLGLATRPPAPATDDPATPGAGKSV